MSVAASAATFCLQAEEFMPRFTAFLRGVSPMNAKMPELKAAFESAGFANVRTVLASGNVVFDSERTDEREIERLAEEAMMRALGRSFYTVVRSCAHLADVLAADWYATHGIPPQAKRVITFMREAAVPRVCRVGRHSAPTWRGAGVHAAHRAGVWQGCDHADDGYRGALCEGVRSD